MKKQSKKKARCSHSGAKKCRYWSDKAKLMILLCKWCPKCGALKWWSSTRWELPEVLPRKRAK